ncbi:MAG: hypothetical protein Q8Q39_01195 [bacterium]|nr:hypothetical protein [bacterium]
MKIVKRGKKGPGWMGKKLKCPNCNCTFKLEKGDKVKTVLDQRDGDYWEVKCPQCKAMVTQNITKSVSWDPMDR